MRVPKRKFFSVLKWVFPMHLVKSFLPVFQLQSSRCMGTFPGVFQYLIRHSHWTLPCCFYCQLKSIIYFCIFIIVMKLFLALLSCHSDQSQILTKQWQERVEIKRWCLFRSAIHAEYFREGEYILALNFQYCLKVQTIGSLSCPVQRINFFKNITSCCSVWNYNATWAVQTLAYCEKIKSKDTNNQNKISEIAQWCSDREQMKQHPDWKQVPCRQKALYVVVSWIVRSTMSLWTPKCFIFHSPITTTWWW